MSNGEGNNNTNNRVPAQVAKYLKQVRRNTITHEFGQGVPKELLTSQENDNHSSQAAKLLRQGMQQQQAGDLIAAIKSLEQSLEMFQLAGNTQQQQQVLSLLALIAYTSGDYRGVISYSQKCLSIK